MQQPPSLAGKVALVTGASRGIGKGVALELGKAGATVYVTGRTTAPGMAELPGTIGETALQITRSGGQGIAVTCDHANDPMVKEVFRRIADEQGRLDLLVNSAATLQPKADRQRDFGKRFWETDLSLWETYHQIGLRSHYVASAHAARMMVPRQQGLIVNVSSAGAKQYFHSVAYASAKAALDKLTADMAHELRKLGVSVVSIWPGLTRTEMVSWMHETGMMDASGAETPAFSGQAVVALLHDAEIAKRSGEAYFVADLARDYGFTDIDGRVHARPELNSIVTKRPARGTPA